jgi:hypothetical protein
LVGPGRTNRTGKVTIAITSTNKALANATNEPTRACRLSGTDLRLARVHMCGSLCAGQTGMVK